MKLFFVQQNIDYLYGTYLTTAVVSAPSGTTTDQVKKAVVKHFKKYDVTVEAKRLTISILANCPNKPFEPVPVGINAVDADKLREGMYLLAASTGVDNDI